MSRARFNFFQYLSVKNCVHTRKIYLKKLFLKTFRILAKKKRKKEFKNKKYYHLGKNKEIMKKNHKL